MPASLGGRRRASVDARQPSRAGCPHGRAGRGRGGASPLHHLANSAQNGYVSPLIQTVRTRCAGETAITSFTLVTDRPKLVDGKTVKNEAGYTETLAEFHRVTAFNGLGTSVAKHKKKGDLVEVQGRFHYSKWTDREGVERYAVEIVAEEVLFL